MFSAGFSIAPRCAPVKTFFAMDFCLCGAILSLKAFCFGAIPDSDRVDSLWKCVTEQAVMTVAQWHRNQMIRGPLVIGKQKCLRWIHAYVVQF